MINGNYINITNNNISTSGNGYNMGIHLDASSENNTISSNKIETYGTNAIGIQVYNVGSDGHLIINSNITTGGIRAPGIKIRRGNDVNITSCNITTSNSAVIKVDE